MPSSHMPASPAVPAAACAMICATTLLSAPAAVADVVQATMRIQASEFQDSSLTPPQGATTDSIDAVATVTFNSAVFEMQNLTPDAISGLAITGNNGNVFTYDTNTAGFNSRRFAADDKIRITIGGTIGSVAFMAGLSNDFRVNVDLSLFDYSVLEVSENFTFVTPSDPSYRSQNTTVTLLDLVVTPDSDNDTLIDTQDNCIEASNLDQRDTDGDGIGNRCDADFNQDCIVNVVDLAALRADFFALGNLDTDLDGDGSVNVTDLGIVRSLFFQPPGPSGIVNLCAP